MKILNNYLSLFAAERVTIYTLGSISEELANYISDQSLYIFVRINPYLTVLFLEQPIPSYPIERVFSQASSFKQKPALLEAINLLVFCC